MNNLIKAADELASGDGAREAGEAAVKPLVWVDYDATATTVSIAKTPFGNYWTSRSSFGYRLAVNDNHVESFKTHQEAIAVAQADYETRIRSALDE